MADQQVVAHGGEVVAVVGLVAAAVAPQVDRRHRVPEPVQALAHRLPRAAVRCQPVDEEHRRRRRRRPHQRVQLDPAPEREGVGCRDSSPRGYGRRG